MVRQTMLGWTLIAASMTVLAVSGRLGLAAVLLPLSVVLGYTLTRAGTKRTKFSAAAKRG